MITVENLCFDYPGKRALDHVSFTITPGTITALVGPNGAGKTTLLRCLSALESPMLGNITVDGWDTDRFPRNVHQVSSYLSDFFGLYDELTVAQHLKFCALSFHCPTDQIKTLIEDAAKRLNIWEYKDVAAGKLSRGLRQRLAIAQTILHKPKILFLDEPASGLDPEARYNLSKLLLSLQKEQMTLVVSSHILAELEDYCTHMIVLHDGKMVKHCQLSDYQSSQKNTIILRVTFTDKAERYAEVLKTIPHVTVISFEQNTAILEFQGNTQDQQALLKILVEKALPVISVQEQKQRMQEVYLNIAQESEKKEKAKKAEEEKHKK